MKMTRILHLEIECCYGCPNCSWIDGGWEYLEKTGETGYFYCVEAWNSDDYKNEESYIIKDLGNTPDWCPLPRKVELDMGE
jgi:hypothetical protein